MIGSIGTVRRDNAYDRICLKHVIFLKYTGSKDGNICLEFEYIPSDSSINYLEVSYSNPELEKYVEGNPNVLRNIDAYLRNKLLEREFNYS
jgi:hypothetical protein